jgi:hypothetical protein
VTTDTVYSNTKVIANGSKCAQLYVGRDSIYKSAYGCKTNKQFTKTLQDEIQENRAMDVLYSDGASAQVGQKAKEIMRSFVIDNWASKPHNPNQNFAEQAWRDTKRNVNATINMTGAPTNTWLLALKYVIYLMNQTAIASLNWRTPYKKMWGVTPDISAMLEYHFYKPVHYKTLKPRFPKESMEQQGCFVGISENVGNAMTYDRTSSSPRIRQSWNNQ